MTPSVEKEELNFNETIKTLFHAFQRKFVALALILNKLIVVFAEDQGLLKIQLKTFI